MAITNTLSGYKNVCRRNIGGVSIIAHIPVQDIRYVTIKDGVITEIKCKYGKWFKEYQSVVDSAEFKVSTQEVSITHRFNSLSKESSLAYNELLEVAACGIASLVKMNNGATALLGWSEEFGNRRPLMAIEAEGTSGKAPTDPNYLDVTLKSSIVKAPLYLSDAMSIEELLRDPDGADDGADEGEGES